MMGTPIISSLLDLDFYKLTMCQVAWKRYPGATVTYAFKNRTKGVALAEYVKEEDLRRELDHVRALRFAKEELAYLEGLGIFRKDFINFLSTLKLSPYVLERVGDTYRIEVTGLWPDAILWETLILSVVNELYYRAWLEKKNVHIDQARKEGRARLWRKTQILQAHYPDIKIIEFGTRRRFSGEWQEYVTRTLADQAQANLAGTSNVLLAKKLGLRPIGTFAHEMDMVYSGIFHESDDEIRASHHRVLEEWWEEYGEPLSIALTDTYGTDFFFKDFTPEQARKWKGLRQDSGDPIAFGKKAIACYKAHGIDPMTKLVVFSDGLDLQTIVKLHHHFKNRIQVAFGWGTNLTNDMGFKALSLVVKAVKSCGYGTVKLSDNLAKAMGDPADIERFKKIFGYTRTFHEECRY